MCTRRVGRGVFCLPIDRRAGTSHMELGGPLAVVIYFVRRDVRRNSILFSTGFPVVGNLVIVDAHPHPLSQAGCHVMVVCPAFPTGAQHCSIPRSGGAKM